MWQLPLKKQEDLEKFWKGIFEDEKEHNKEAEWTWHLEKKKKNQQEMHPMINDEEKMRKHLEKAPNFKCPGPDGIPNFWLKQLDALNNHCTQAFKKLTQEEEVMEASSSSSSCIHGSLAAG